MFTNSTIITASRTHYAYCAITECKNVHQSVLQLKKVMKILIENKLYVFDPKPKRHKGFFFFSHFITISQVICIFYVAYIYFN